VSARAGLNRRDFLRLAGGGIVVFVGAGAADSFSQEHQPPLYPEDFNAYLLIGADGRTTVFSPKVEMGQGVMTSQAQMVAEELGVDLESIDMVLGDTDRCPPDRGTFGSLTTRMFGPALRAAAAEARTVLLGLAAQRLGVPADRLVVRGGVVLVRAEATRRVTYAELARGQRLARLVSTPAVLHSAAQFQVMGRSPRRLDARDKVTGSARYAADMRVAGQLYARLLRPPAHGAALTHLDTAAAQALPGVTVVREADLVAVLHADPEVAARALTLVRAQWHQPPAALDADTIFDHLVSSTPSLHELANRGDLAAAQRSAVRLFDSTYRKGYVAHAPLEPHAALAEVTAERVTVWASTQTPFPTRDRVAQALGRPTRDVRVITPFLGGGFGGKSADRQAVEAARLARLCGRPVQVAWDRSEEFFYDRFDPAGLVTVRSGIDGSGRIVLWDYTAYSGERGAQHLYDVPALRIRTGGGPPYGGAAAPQVHPFEVGPWRAPGANMNVFAIESQMDLMAAALRADPLEFRLRHLHDARMRKVLQTAADAFGWPAAAQRSGRGVGLACSTDAGSYVATLAEVSVDRTSGEVRARRVVCAEDLGTVVNPDGARAQIEGAVMMGLGYSLMEELKFRGGEILDRNFSSYQLPRFSHAPQVEAIVVPHDELTPQGGGEPPITTMGAALANALFDATGARLLRLPMTPERVAAAVQAVGAAHS